MQVMKDCCSLTAICIETGRVMAVAICKVMSLDEFDWTLWKILPTISKQLEKFFTIQYDIIKTSELNKGTCFQVFDVVVCDELRARFPDKSFEVVLLKQAFTTAQSLKTHFLSYTCFRQMEAAHAANSCMHVSGPPIRFAISRVVIYSLSKPTQVMITGANFLILNFQICKEIHYSFYTDSLENKIFKNVQGETTAFLFTRRVSKSKEKH